MPSTLQQERRPRTNFTPSVLVFQVGIIRHDPVDTRIPPCLGSHYKLKVAEVVGGGETGLWCG